MRLKKKDRAADQSYQALLRNLPNLPVTPNGGDITVTWGPPPQKYTSMERLEMTLGQCIVCKSEADLLICALCSEGVKVARNAYLADLQSLIEGDLI